MNLPKELKYSKDHEWLRVDGSNAVVGITEFAQRELGDIVFVDVDIDEEDLEKEEVFGSVEAVKTVADLYSPMSGKVINVNEDLNNEPELVNHDPFGMGWLIKIQTISSSQSKNLLTADEYADLVG